MGLGGMLGLELEGGGGVIKDFVFIFKARIIFVVDAFYWIFNIDNISSMSLLLLLLAWWLNFHIYPII
jgi:hypothetical protein